MLPSERVEVRVTARDSDVLASRRQALHGGNALVSVATGMNASSVADPIAVCKCSGTEHAFWTSRVSQLEYIHFGVVGADTGPMVMQGYLQTKL